MSSSSFNRSHWRLRELRAGVMSGMRAKLRISTADVLVCLRRECDAIEGFPKTSARSECAERPGQCGLLLSVSSIVRRRGHRGMVLVAVTVPDGFRRRQCTGAGGGGLLAWKSGPKKSFPPGTARNISELKLEFPRSRRISYRSTFNARKMTSTAATGTNSGVTSAVSAANPNFRILPKSAGK